MKKHFELLGLKVRDVVTGFTGIVSMISFDLYGCVQAIVTPEMTKEAKLEDGRWFDTKRLIALSKEPVMPVPSFEIVPGGEAHPSFPSIPIPRTVR